MRPKLGLTIAKRRNGILVTALAACLAATACTSTTPTITGAQPEQSTEAANPLTITVSPDNGAGSMPASTEVGIKIGGGGSVTDVTVVNATTGQPVSGALRADGTTWVPADPLAYGTQFTATVTARSSADQAKTQTATTTFSTMGQPGHETGTGLYMFDGETVGVAMPVVIEFDEEVPEEARAGVQQRLFVTTDPPQPGVWHWASGRQVWYRAPDYWKPGTTITVRSALQGVPTGNGSYGDSDRRATVTVGNKVFMDVDNESKQMNVFVDDQLTNTMPVSLGKPDTPSSSGAMVLMTKEATRTFDTRGEPNGGYVVDVNWAMRLTWGGEFIHAAPWSVGQQGNSNVSHGCVNMSDGNSAWLFGIAHVGDPIIVRGTEVPLSNGNGWTAWNQTWAEYVQGSALPVDPALATQPGVDPATGKMPPAPAPAPSQTSAPQVPAAQPAPTR
jgi:lipoprotein-anchoring transpeptidase ErfK/SrfK